MNTLWVLIIYYLIPDVDRLCVGVCNNLFCNRGVQGIDGDSCCLIGVDQIGDQDTSSSESVESVAHRVVRVLFCVDGGRLLNDVDTVIYKS